VSVIETRTCFHEPDPRGFVRLTLRVGIDVDHRDAIEMVAATSEAAGGVLAPVLVDMRGIRSLSREARKYLVSAEVAARTSPIALLVGSPVSRVIGNFFLTLGPHQAPTSLFTDEDAAIAWLRAGR
jgi:hypothetical protein